MILRSIEAIAEWVDREQVQRAYDVLRDALLVDAR